MYVRSGEFNPDTVYKYLKTAKQLDPESKLPPLHPEIKKACQRLGIQNPEKKLSDSPP